MKLRTALMGAVAVTALAPLAALAERGSDGEVKILYWQAPSILNPYLSSGTKDIESSSMIIEPLGRYDQDGNLVPFLAQDIPTIENGGVSEDLKTITWKLKEGLLWSDGTPVTSADVKFTADYCMAPDGGCAQLAKFDGVESIETPDDLTVVVHFSEAKPNPYGPFTGGQSPIIQAAQFAECLGAKAPECTSANFGPIGTGPFKVDEFRPNDVITMSANENYRDPAKPAFAKVTFKGGGDAAAAARAVMETGEFDYAWNLQIPPEELTRMAGVGKGTPVVAFGTSVERIMFNMTDPNPDLGEERSTKAHPHPFLTDPAVRQAMSMAIDRQLLTEIGYGEFGKPTCDLVPAPAVYASADTSCLTQDLEGAKKVLDDAGWVAGGDGIRAKDGVRLSVLYQTSVNAVRQDFQALIKEWWNEIGVEVELRSVDASVFFGGDPGSPDTFQKFYADVEMYTNNFDGTDPEAYLGQNTCDHWPGPDSQWQGENIPRYCDPKFDELVAELSKTGEVDKRGEISKELNHMITTGSNTMLPLVWRGRVAAHANSLGGVVINPWDSELWNVADWYRVK